jgi:ribosomally synthesized peptide (two-chain TOMM family)
MSFTNKIPSFESLLEFQEVYLRAIALSWRDDKFKRRLIEDPLLALQHYFAYKCPWNIKLEIRELGPESGYGWNKSEQKWNLPKNGMTFGVPVKPDSIGEEAIALAAYNDAGPTYLFSCC